MKVLIGYDGSDSAKVAIDLAASLPWPSGSTVRLVTAIDASKFEIAYFPVGPQNIQQAFEKEKQLDEARLVEAGQHLQREGVTVERAVIPGRPPLVLATEAAEMKADLIIVGSRGRGAMATTLAGSVSAETIDLSTVPVLVARSPAIERVLAADDGSDAAACAINCLIRWPVLAAVDVEVLSVVTEDGRSGSSPADVAAGPIDDAARTSPARLQHFHVAHHSARRLQACGHPADWMVSSGRAVPEIVRAASDLHADLIVMGTRGHTGVDRLVHGSVSRGVLTHSDCSLLVVQPPHLN
jgi:nucleotide-binding universal stress UspA family protein